MNKTFKALALGAATTFSASAALAEEQDNNAPSSVPQAQREAVAEEMGKCVGNRVYGAVQAADLYSQDDKQQGYIDRLQDAELMVMANSLVPCFAAATGYNRLPLADQAPDWPQTITDFPEEIYTNPQAFEDFMKDALGDWMPLIEREVDENVLLETYNQITAAIPLLK